MNDFYANQYSNQATEKDDHTDAHHSCDTVGVDDLCFGWLLVSLSVRLLAKLWMNYCV